MTTKNEIYEWLKDAKKKKATHVLILCDSFDYEDYPVYVFKGQNVRDVIKEKCKADNMQRLMEVYNLSMDIEKQLKEHRSFNY